MENNKLKKGTIIVGKTGKSSIAAKLASLYNDDEVVKVQKSNLPWDTIINYCNKKTRLIIVESVGFNGIVALFPAITSFKYWLDILPTAIPNIVVVCKPCVTCSYLGGASLTGRFNIIDTDQPNFSEKVEEEVIRLRQIMNEIKEGK